MIWRELDNFSSGSVCMVLASNHYDEDDYFRDYEEYMRARGLITLPPPNPGSPVIAMGGLA
jgi:hypothetical protein